MQLSVSDARDLPPSSFPVRVSGLTNSGTVIEGIYHEPAAFDMLAKFLEKSSHIIVVLDVESVPRRWRPAITCR